MATSFTFNEEQFNRFFPFYLLLDQDLVVENCGKTMEKLFPGCKGNKFELNFMLKRPVISELSFQSLKLLTHQVLVFDCLVKNKIMLRGQLEYLADANKIMLLLSPWFDSIETVLENDLKLNDFALHDSMIDLLHVLKAHEINTDDMKLLFATVNQQKKELKKLSLIAEETINGIIVTDAEGKIEWTNKGFFNITGYSLNEMIGKSPGSVLQGENSSKETIAYLKNQILKKEPFDCEILNYHKTGHPYWIRINGQPLFDKSGNVVQFFALEEDITKEKHAQELLKESETRLSKLIQNLQTGVLLEDENCNVLLSNDRYCKMFQFDSPPEKLMGPNCITMDALKGLIKNPKGYLERIKELLENKQTVLGDEIELANEQLFERNYIPIFHNSAYAGHLWTYDDVTMKRNYQKNLQAQKDKYSSIISNMNLGLLEVDHNDVIQFANQSFCEMSGYSLKELIGQKGGELLLFPESQEVLNERNQMRTEGISDSYEVKVKIKSGKKRYWLISGAPNYDVNGNVIGSIGIHLDITHMKKLESQKEMLLKNLAIQNEHLNEYAHIVSHDLKSPLRNISALLSWTIEDFQEKLGEESLRNLQLMQLKVEKMDHLIENILKYSSIDKGTTDIEKVNLNKVVKGILDMIYIPNHIKVKVLKELPVIDAETTRIQQLFQNLISNAVNYTDKSEGIVEIDYTENDSHYIFSVKDNGIGIAKEHHEKIFKIFSTLGNNEKSSGIGLNIVKKVVELYEGEIWLESELGQGTTFYFSIKK